MGNMTEHDDVTMSRCSMYGIFTYIWAIFRVNVGKYSFHDNVTMDCK